MCLQAENYALVLGYPGTGKTYTIAHLLFLLSSIKKKVLVCTYTHAALDNLLEKLVKEFPKEAENIVRLASTKNENVSLCSKEFLLSFDKFNDISGVKEFLKSKYLYFTTCLSVNEALDL
jgi:DNA replication ATP-dependent helicase Dna2